MKVSQKLFHTAISLLLFLNPFALHGNTSLNVPSEIRVVNSIIKFDIKKLQSFGTLDKIVIDAGHGGKDHGCSGAHSKEKFIVLDIALKLGELVKFYHPEIEVIYTRDTDVFIPLDTRIGIANSQQADLFISIHANYIHKHHVRGTETYVMGLHRAKENLEVAKRENSAILYESDYENTYGGYDPNSPEAHILLSMFQNSFLEKSINIATKIEDSFTKRTLLKSRGVKQAGFLVLRKATMPSTLIETGFLSSRDDEAYLMSEKGQDEVANAILKAITEYKREIEGEYWVLEEQKRSIHPPKSPEKATIQTSSPVVSTPQPIADNNQHPKTYSGATGYYGNTFTQPSKQLENLDHKPIQSSSDMTKPNSKIYRIQIAAGLEKLIDSKTSKFSEITDLEIRKEDNMYKYLTGHFQNLNDAFSARENMRNKGFNGAFIVSYMDNVRVTF